MCGWSQKWWKHHKGGPGRAFHSWREALKTGARVTPGLEKYASKLSTNPAEVLVMRKGKKMLISFSLLGMHHLLSGEVSA